MSDKIKYFLMGLSVATTFYVFVIIGVVILGMHNTNDEEYTYVKEIGPFVCDNFENVKNTFNEDFVISNGKLYTITTTLKFSNEQNCKQISDIDIARVVDSYFIGTDNNVYTFDNETLNLKTYVTNGRIPEYVMSADVVMAYSYGNSNEYKYYVLKTDGKIYDVSFNREYRFTNGTGSYLYNVISEEVYKEYEGELIKSFTVINDEITSLITDKSIYERKITNTECTGYADVECIYELHKNELFTESMDNVGYVSTINGITYVTNDNVIYRIEG